MDQLIVGALKGVAGSESQQRTDGVMQVQLWTIHSNLRCSESATVTNNFH